MCFSNTREVGSVKQDSYFHLTASFFFVIIVTGIPK